MKHNNMIEKEECIYKCGTCKKILNKIKKTVLRLYANKLNGKWECEDCSPYCAKESVWLEYVEKCKRAGFKINK